jgi:hypothetical protein
MKRVFFKNFRSLSDPQAKRISLDIFFTSADGGKYIWTPEWKKETNQLFMEAYSLLENVQVKKGKTHTIAAPAIKETGLEREVINIRQLAFKVSEILRSKTTESMIEEVASSLFDFKAEFHTNTDISSTVGQSIYDWIMTLGEQPINQETKLRLLRQFIAAMAPIGSALKKLADTGG